MAQIRLDILRPTQNPNLEFSTSSIHELGFLTSYRKILNLQHLARRILNFLASCQDLGCKMLKIQDLIAHIQKLTPVNSHFYIFISGSL